MSLFMVRQLICPRCVLTHIVSAGAGFYSFFQVRFGGLALVH